MGFPARGPLRQPIFCYENYRLFLHALVQEARMLTPAFSWRYLARRLGYRSGAAVRHVLSGKNRLTEEMLNALCRVLGLTSRERQYLRLMARAEHVEAADERRLVEIEACRLLDVDDSVHVLNRGQDAWDWRDLGVLAALSCPDFAGDYSSIGAAMAPAMPPDQVRRTVERLVRLGLASRSSGRTAPVHPVVKAGTVPDEPAARRTQRHALQLAASALDTLPETQVAYGTMVLPLRQSELPSVVAELKRCMQTLCGIARRAGPPEKVYLLTVNMTPILSPAVGMTVAGGGLGEYGLWDMALKTSRAPSILWNSERQTIPQQPRWGGV